MFCKVWSWRRCTCHCESNFALNSVRPQFQKERVEFVFELRVAGTFQIPCSVTCARNSEAPSSDRRLQRAVRAHVTGRERASLLFPNFFLFGVLIEILELKEVVSISTVVSHTETGEKMLEHVEDPLWGEVGGQLVLSTGRMSQASACGGLTGSREAKAGFREESGAEWGADRGGSTTPPGVDTWLTEDEEPFATKRSSRTVHRTTNADEKKLDRQVKRLCTTRSWSSQARPTNPVYSLRLGTIQRNTAEFCFLSHRVSSWRPQATRYSAKCTQTQRQEKPSHNSKVDEVCDFCKRSAHVYIRR